MIGTKDDGTVIYHDPDSAPNSEMSVANFNSRRQSFGYALMRRERKTATSEVDLTGLLELFGN